MRDASVLRRALLRDVNFYEWVFYTCLFCMRFVRCVRAEVGTYQRWHRGSEGARCINVMRRIRVLLFVRHKAAEEEQGAALLSFAATTATHVTHVTGA
jgi:hypothetical protein